jgi:Asp/Glu/hydantoin racemase
MRVLVVLPAVKGIYPIAAEQRRVDVVKSFSTDCLQVDVGFPTQESGYVPMSGEGSAVEIARNNMMMADRMFQAEAEGYDACVPFGMRDFGVEIARARCRIPIVAQAQACFAMATMMANRVGVITYVSQSHGALWQQLKEYGYLHMVVGLGAAEIPNAQMPARRAELFDRFVSEGKRLVTAGAELIVCHGMSMSPVEFKAQDYADAIGVPVLEGVGCALAMAQAWVYTGTPYSRLRHPAYSGKDARHTVSHG